jgi:hypothetical protein
MMEGMQRAALLVGLLLFALPVRAQSFSDVPPSREEFDAVEDLLRRGIVEGRPDGTFGPDDFVNRAEAVTIVVRAVANVRNLPPLSDCFPDVRGEEWYVRPVCYAEDLEWVSGYPDGTFQPVRTVAKVEFLKILINAYGIDAEPWGKMPLPLAHDVTDPEQWYYPFLAYALQSSMTRPDAQGNLHPGIALTRGQVALLLHRFLLYREGKRTQVLLTEVERDIRHVFGALSGSTLDVARFAAGRARIMAWGVALQRADAPVVSATVKLADALLTLVRAHELEQQGDLTQALRAAQEAFHLAEEADTYGGNVERYTLQVREVAHQLANAIRAREE